MEVAEQNMLMVPKLRFREFEEGWQEQTLENLVAKKISYGIVQAGNHVEGGMPYIKSTDLNAEIVGQNLQCTSEEIAKKYKRSEVVPGDIVFSLRGNIGVTQIVPNELTVANLTQGTARISVTSNNDNLFLNQRLQTNSTNKEILAVSKGSTFQEISLTDLRNVKVILPNLPEQKKIAGFLSALDEKLKHLNRKKQLLQKYKKGVMQQLFSQQLRFKREDGSDYEDWEEKMLGEVGIIQTGKTPSTSDSDLWGGEVQFITPTDIDDEKKYQLETERFVPFNEKLKIIPVGSIVYTCIASIGKISLTVKPAITNQQINAVVTNERWNSELVYYQLLWLTPKIKSTQANTTLPIINKTEFSKIRLNLPSSSEEQQKIADFLSSLDEKIDAVDTQIALTQQFKKGLLQELFV